MFLLTLTPLTQRDPLVVFKIPVIILIRVDLPAPLGPSNPKIYPFSIFKEKSKTA